MKNMIITMALVILFAMLICFQWELNSRCWQAMNGEGKSQLYSAVFLKI